MHRLRHVVVALARTPADAGLIRYAAMPARLGSIEELRFVHVLPARAGSAGSPEHGRTLAQLETEVAATLSDLPAGLRVCCDVLSGPLVERLLAFADEQETDLIIVGHRPNRPGHRSLARQLAMRAPSSVWMVPDGSAAALSRILVPVDFSEHSLDTVRVATSLARAAGAECLATHVRLRNVMVAHEGAQTKVAWEAREPSAPGAEQSAWERFIEQVDCQGVAVQPIFEQGAVVADTIHRTALERSADLIVAATRGRTRSAALLLGSVTEKLLVQTRVPLLVVKHFGARLHLLQALLDRALGR